jgi:16S rRNA (cytosine967-C5)-methyltransferase
LKNLILLQAKLLDASWTILRTGGILIYSTCSIFYNEGENQILKFLKRTKDAERKSAPGLIEPKIGIDLYEKPLTCIDKKNIRKDWLGNDGFFYAILKKKN